MIYTPLQWRGIHYSGAFLIIIPVPTYHFCSQDVWI